MNTPISFSKNNLDARIRADSGTLFSSKGCYLSRSIGHFDGNNITGIAAAINCACLDILYEIGNTKSKAQQTKTLEDASLVRAFYLKAQQALEGIKIIHGAYSKRCEVKWQEEMHELAQVVFCFEKRLKDFEKRGSSLEPKIISESNFLDFEMDFFLIPEPDGLSEAGTSKAFMQSEQRPQVSSWWGTYGLGPTILGKVASAINTVKELSIGTIFPYAFTPSFDLTLLRGQRRVANGGKQLGSGDIYRYLEGINKNVPLNALHSFHIGLEDGVNSKSLDEVKEIIRSHIEDFSDPNLPIIIPLVFSKGGVWERNHISVILIKDNCVEYYDAKGIVSEHKALAEESGMLRDVLEFCKDCLTNEGVIYENPYTHQYDAHNCGVLVCRYLHDRLITNNLMGTMAVAAPSILEVEDFRLEILNTAYPPENSGDVGDIYCAPSSSKEGSDVFFQDNFDDFSM